MIAYNKEWLDNAALQQEVEQAYHEQCISREEKERIHAAYPVGFYSPNPYIRIGLFLLTAVIVLFSLGLFMLMLMGAVKDAWRGLLIFFGLAVYGALELFIRELKHYRSGVDDGLLWGSVALLITALNLDLDMPTWMRCALTFIIAAYATLRFADMLMSVVAVLALLGCVFYIYLLTGDTARLTAPFVIIAISIALYQLAARLSQNDKWRHYAHCCTTAKVSALITLYVAGNYFVVRETSIHLLDLDLFPGQPLPAGWLFWTTTALIPVIYILLGVKKKDAILLRTGLLLSAASAFTLRHYYSIMPLEAVMTLIGLLLIGLAYALIRYLKTPKQGFTYHQLDRTQLFEQLQAESLVITETFTPPPTPAPGFKFGGGSGGGAGADGSW